MVNQSINSIIYPSYTHFLTLSTKKKNTPTYRAESADKHVAVMGMRGGGVESDFATVYMGSFLWFTPNDHMSSPP